MPLDLAIAPSQPSSSASFSAGSESVGSCLPSSLPVAGLVVSYVKLLRKLRLRAAEQLPPTPISCCALDYRDDADHGNAEPFDLHRAAERLFQEFHEHHQKQAKQCA